MKCGLFGKKICDKHAPIKRRKIRNKSNPWITEQLLHEKRHKNYLKQKACKTGNLNDWDVRIITKSGYEVRSVNLLHQLGLPNLEERRNQQLNTLMYKVRHEMAPSSLSNMFQKTNEVHEHRTRQAKHDFLPPKPKTNYLKKAFSYRGAVAWNNLPNEIKNSETVNIFKAKLKIIN